MLSVFMTFILCPLIDFFFFCFFFGLLPQQIFCLHLTCLCHTNHLRRLSLHPCTFSVIVFLFASCLPAQSLPSFVQYFHYHFLCTCVYKEFKKNHPCSVFLYLNIILLFVYVCESLCVSVNARKVMLMAWPTSPTLWLDRRATPILQPLISLDLCF